MKHYGKESNYYFNCLNESKYTVSIHTNTGTVKEAFADIDSCISWLVYYIESQDWKPRWDCCLIQRTSREVVKIKEYRDYNSLLEDLWRTFTDVNIDEDEYIEQNWFIFEKGTHREYIWHWFDERHSKGVAWLMYDLED